MVRILGTGGALTMATCKHGATIRFTGQVTNSGGDIFRDYEAPDGCGTGIRIRKGRYGKREFTARQAKAEAVRRLARGFWFR